MNWGALALSSIFWKEHIRSELSVFFDNSIELTWVLVFVWMFGLYVKVINHINLYIIYI